MPKVSTKVTTRKRAGKRRSAKNKARKGKSLTALNAWMTENYGALMRKARQNCIRLTGRPSFGGATRRKSA